MTDTYFKEYWKKHKHEYNALRRKRYREDSAYREKAKRRAVDFWRKNRVPLKRDRTIVTDDSGAPFSTVGHIATLINRSTFTVREYCRRGVIPKADLCSEEGAHLFSQGQVDVIVDVFRLFDANKLKSLVDVAANIKRRWVNGKEEAES